MSTEELRRELARIGETAPVAEVPADTYARAQRARRRDRLAVVAGAAAAVAIVVGLVAWLPDRSAPQPADGTRPGVPETIWSIPRGVFTEADAETDLAMGQAAVALLSDDGVAVVVGAADGAYHPLRLPGWGDMQAAQGVLSLSPDGRQLAWPWSGSADEAGPTPTGIRIVDLVTGDQRSIPLTGGEGVVVYEVVWSPDSSWIVWRGNSAAQWSNSAYSAGKEVAGRIAPGRTTTETLPTTNDESTRLAVDDDGRVLIATTDRQTWWDGRVLDSGPRPGGWYPVALTPQDGVLLETRTRNPSRDELTIAYRLVADPGPVAAPALAQLKLAPAGLLDRVTLVARSQRYSDSPNDVARPSQLSLINLSDGTIRTVGEVESDGLVTLAIDLMSPENPTVPRPEPAWLHPDEGWSDAQISIAIGLGVAGVLALLQVGRWWWRRRLPLR